MGNNQKFEIEKVSQKFAVTLDKWIDGHMLYLPALDQDATLIIECQDGDGNIYPVKNISMTKGQSQIIFIDPTATPYTNHILWTLEPTTNIPTLPYQFSVGKHGAL